VKKPIAVVTASALAVVAVGLATPAQAYDTDAYAYAAGHMIHRSDIPSALGAFKKNPSFNAGAGRFPTYLCYVPSADPNASGTDHSFPSGSFQFSASYEAPGTGDKPSINVAVNQYANAERAIAAFDEAKKRAKQCTGTSANTYTDPNDGSTSSYSTLLTNGVVPYVTTLGVEAVFVSTNNLSETTPGDSRFINDQYTVVSLVGDVVFVTTYYLNTNTNITSKQRKAVDRVTFNAQTRWLP
jgi:hypothetical protein